MIATDPTTFPRLLCVWTLKKSGFQIKGISTHSSVLPPVSTLLSVCLLVYLFVLLSDFLSVCVRLSVCLSTCLFVLPLSEAAAKTICSYVVVVGQFLSVRFQVS